MAYQLITAPSNQEAVMSALSTFAQANGWTEEHYTAAVVGVSRGVMTLSRGTVFVSFRWEGTDRNNIAMYHSLGFTLAQAATPWNHPDDSGDGTTSTSSLTSQRRVDEIGSGPYTSLHMFASATDALTTNSAPHIYCVLEISPFVYRHFAFGIIDKFGDGWTGGEFCAGHLTVSTTSINSTSVSVLLDGRTSRSSTGTDSRSNAALHCEGLPGQDVSSKWGRVSTSTSSTGNTDRAGNPRVFVIGGCRRSLWSDVFNALVPSTLGEYQPLSPMPVFYRRDTSGNNRRHYYLGAMPNARMIQMRNFEPGDRFTVGSVEYMVFPVSQKAVVGVNGASGNMGIAYVRVP